MPRKTRILPEESYCEGNLDESTISYFLKHLDNYTTSKKTKHRLKVILVELISNIIIHSDTTYGSVSVLETEGGFRINALNYTGPEKLTKIIDLVNRLKTMKSPREHYLQLLSGVSYENQVSLGLLEIVRLCEGNIDVTCVDESGKPAINFDILVNNDAL